MSSDNPCERIVKWKTCPILKEGKLLVCLAGASVTKTATLLGVSKATVSEVMAACKNHEKTLAKKNSEPKSTLTEIIIHWEDCVENSHNCCSRTEYSS
jgi:predicted transcriptional regulator